MRDPGTRVSNSRVRDYDDIVTCVCVYSFFFILGAHTYRALVRLLRIRKSKFSKVRYAKYRKNTVYIHSYMLRQ